MKTPKIVGIVNITEDSFSDGSLYLAADDAVAHARQLINDGADIIELGPASSHPDAALVPDDEQIKRLTPVLDALVDLSIPLSIDATRPAVQRFSLAQGVAQINDIRGFPDPHIYADLAASGAKLVVMHSVVRGEKAGRVDTDPAAILSTIQTFFEHRVEDLTKQGLSRNNLILDPGMGFFLGTNPETSLAVLKGFGEIREHFNLPVMISVSRKSFLQKIAGRPVESISAATLAAELFAAEQGADYIRTHEPGPLRDALSVIERLRGG